jgi:hypothetical protein
MPIRGRSLGDVTRIFVDQLNAILHTTVTQMPLSFEVAGSIANIRFRRGIEPAPAQLQTHYGPMGLYIGQLCDSTIDDQRVYTLRTTSYRYALLPEGHADPLLRWEYVRTRATDTYYCRHHFQGPIHVGITDRDGREGSFQNWHLPTGWVAIEEVLRFCIVDLGVEPLDDEWDTILSDSYERSITEFAVSGEE